MYTGSLFLPHDNNSSNTSNDKLIVNHGQYLAFPFYNHESQPMYIHSIDLRVAITNTNIRGTLYYTKKNPALRKFSLNKDDWIDARHSIRFFSYNSAVLKKEGAVIHIELKEIMIEAMREYNSYPKYPPYRLDELQE